MTVWHAHGLGRVRSIEPAARGVRNECYIVNGNLVARFNTLDPQFAKFRNERAVYEQLADSGLPVPKMLLLDESRSVVPYDLIVLTRLPGMNVAESWQELSPRQLNNVVGDAGRALAALHRVTFDGFGKLAALADRPFDSWGDYLRDYVQRYLVRAQGHNLIDASDAARLEKVLDRGRNLFESVTRGALVHSDFHYENVLQDHGKLTGILDFEWALSGDPSYDFIATGVREDMIPGSEGAFLEGYESQRVLDDMHEQRLTVYRLFFHLEDAVMCSDAGDLDGARAALVRMDALLSMVE